MNNYENVGTDKKIGGYISDDIKRSDSIMVRSTLTVCNKVFKELGKGYAELFVEIKSLFKKNIRRILRSVLIGIVAFTICVGLGFLVLYVMGTYNRYIFSTENWNTYKSDRINMVESMESKIHIKGMAQKDVEKILGKPSYVTSKDNCEYIDLLDKEYDEVAEYTLNKDSKSITDIIEKNYVIAYKSGKVVYADVLISDKSTLANKVKN